MPEIAALQKIHQSNLPEKEKRKQQSQVIIDNFKSFKLCCGCSSLILEIEPICTICHAYNFEHAKESIIEQALKLGNQEKTILTASDFE